MVSMNQKIILGDRWVECDDCGFGYRFSQMRKGVQGGQKGLDICPSCFDPVHPEDAWDKKLRPIEPMEQVK